MVVNAHSVARFRLLQDFTSTLQMKVIYPFQYFANGCVVFLALWKDSSNTLFFNVNKGHFDVNPVFPGVSL